MGAKVKGADGKGEGWLFVEHTSASRKKCTRFVYYASKPSRDRMTLGEAREDGGYTALGSAGANIDLSALRADEESRRRISPSGATTPQPAKPAGVGEVPTIAAVRTTSAHRISPQSWRMTARAALRMPAPARDSCRRPLPALYTRLWEG